MSERCGTCGQPMTDVGSATLTQSSRTGGYASESTVKWVCANVNCPTNLVDLAPASEDQPSG